MSSKDRRPHETATVLDQQLLDYSQDNLEHKLQLIAVIERPQSEELRYNVTITQASPAVCTAEYHRFIEGQTIIFETDGALPSPLVAGDTYYVRNPANDEFNISSTETGVLIDTTSAGSGSHQVSGTPGYIRVSDRNIFVGERFYEARTKIPLITRTLGEWLRPEIEFSSIKLILNNVDKEFSGMLPAGDNYEGQINKQLDILLGLRDVESTYFYIFNGFISEVAGFKRDVSAVIYVARDKFDKLNIKFPTETFTLTDYPKVSDDVVGTNKPIIYGDYTSSVEHEGNIPSIIVNKGDPQLFKERDLPVSIANGTPSIITLEGHNFDDDDKIRFTTDGTLPSPLSDSTDYYVLYNNQDSFAVSTTPGGSGVNTTGGSGQHNVIAQDLVNVQNVISSTVLQEFQTDQVWLVRSEAFYRISPSDIVNVNGDKNYFEVAQDTGNTTVDGENYVYSDGDKFLLKVIGKDLSGYDDNVISQARDILETYGFAPTADFDSNWDVYRDKASPAQSAIVNIKSRVWIQEPESVMKYALSMLEQVRLEIFISKDLKLKINSMHFEDWEPDPTQILRQFDVVENSIKISIDEKNNFNRAQGFFDFNPNIGENNKSTGIYKNQDAIDQALDKKISKGIEFPNIYTRSDVENQVQEILKLASGYSELIELEVTPRHLLQDLGGFLKVNINIGSTEYDEVPMMIREIGYGTDLKLPIKIWSFQMIPFANPGGWNPGYSGIVGGDTATITEE